MSIKDLTIGKAIEIASLLNAEQEKSDTGVASHLIGKYVIVRTELAGVFCGVLAEKQGKEVLLKDARRMWCWWCKESIALSGVVRHGIKQEKSKICGAIPEIVIEAIEIMPIDGEPLQSILTAPEAEQE